MPKTPKSIEEQIRDFCAYQERCRWEIEQKLFRLKVPKERWEEFLLKMEGEGFWDEGRFCRAYVRGKFRMKGWGKLLIRQGLYAKGVPNDLIEMALESEISESEYLETAQKWARRTKLDAEDEDSRQELLNKIMRKGFTYAEAHAAADTVAEKPDNQ